MLVIVDPDTALPLDQREVFISPVPFLTDESDEALFHNADLAGHLKAHNDHVRAEIKDPEWEDEYLKPARIDDLQKKVVVLATL